jgi:hypothetical protein
VIRLKVTHLIKVFAVKRTGPSGGGILDEEPGRVGVGHERDIARVLVYQPGQRVEVRKLPDMQPVPREGHVELQGLEVIAGAGAGEDGDAVG